MMSRLEVFLAIVPLLLAGCAQNAIFELTLDIPPAPMDRTNLVVEARTGDADWDADWQQTQISGIELDPTTDNTILVSFEASGEKLVDELRVKVRLCAQEQCRDISDGPGNAPEVRYRFERVFYQGRYTTNDQVIEMYPDPATPPEIPVGKCAIVGDGCWDGSSENNCLADGRHFCEDT